MTTTLPAARPLSSSQNTSATTTQRLLLGGAVAGPLFITASLAQALTRTGYDITKQEVSLLSLGHDGWIQTTNFLTAGALFLAGAAGLRSVLCGGKGQRWAPVLMGLIGVGLIGGGIFSVDPSSGFPAGAPTSSSAATANLHGVLHAVFGGLAFLALVALCFVMAHRYSALNQKRRALWARIIGVVCAIGIASGDAPRGSLSLFVGVGLAMLWTGVTSSKLRTGHDATMQVTHARRP